MNKIELFKFLNTEYRLRDQYIDTVPKELQEAVFDNTYINSALLCIDRLIESVYGEHSEAIFWFLHEWKPGFCICIGHIEYTINNIDDYIDFMKSCEGFTE
jgi:hypothetical protein